MTRHFGDGPPEMILEPGRGIAGDADVIEVVLISRKSHDDERRRVHLDSGGCGGRAEVRDECIKCRIRAPRDGGPVGPAVLAGPTRDEVDILYGDAGYRLPFGLEVGDRIEMLSAGAYTTTHASVRFNGFPPLEDYYI